MPSICTKPLTAGEVVIECKPLIHVLKTEFKGKYCDNCLQRSDSLQRCAKCLQMFYCDRNCQTFDWIQHKIECKLNRPRGDLFGGDLDLYRLYRRFMLCIKNDKTFATKRHQLIDGSDVCFNDIEVNVKELLKTTERKESFKRFKNTFKGYGFDRKELLHWFGVFNQKYCKVFLIDYSSEGISHSNCIGLYIETCFISHSCLPNTAIVNNGLTLQVRAMKAIGSGEELTISYVALAQNKSKRHERLDEYSIDCKCRKCELNLDSGLDYGLFRTLSTISTYKIGDESSVRQYIAYLTAFYGKYMTKKTLSLELMFKFYHYMYVRTCSPIPENKYLIQELVKHLKEAIPITHGESHPLATALNQLFAEY